MLDLYFKWSDIVKSHGKELRCNVCKFDELAGLNYYGMASKRKSLERKKIIQPLKKNSNKSKTLHSRKRDLMKPNRKLVFVQLNTCFKQKFTKFVPRSFKFFINIYPLFKNKLNTILVCKKWWSLCNDHYIYQQNISVQKLFM